MFDEAAVQVKPRLSNRSAVARVISSAISQTRTTSDEAVVQVRFVIGADGVPRDVSVVGTTDPAFGPAAVSVVRAMRFDPARQDGRPVAVRTAMPIRFSRGG